MESRYRALLQGAERRGDCDIEALRHCLKLLAFAEGVHRSVSARLQTYRVSSAKLLVLALLNEQREALSPHELSERAGVSRATITGLLIGLERDGLLVRLASQDDGRRRHVVITDAGSRLAERAGAAFAEHLASLGARLQPEQREVVSHAMEQILHDGAHARAAAPGRKQPAQRGRPARCAAPRIRGARRKGCAPEPADPRRDDSGTPE